MSASWLIQMGWNEVYVLIEDGTSFKPAAAKAPRQTPDHLKPHLIEANALAEALKAGDAVVIDLATSIQYRDNGHIPGSWFAIRAHMPANLSALPETGMLVLTSPDGAFAELVLDEARSSGREVKLLEGGTRAWADAGHALEYGFTHMADSPVDLWYKPYEFHDDDKNIEQAMEQYLTWEVDLVGQIERDGTTEFRTFN